MTSDLLSRVSAINARYSQCQKVSDEKQLSAGPPYSESKVGDVPHRMSLSELHYAIELLEVIEMEHLLNQNITLAGYAESLKRMLVDQRERSQK